MPARHLLNNTKILPKAINNAIAGKSGYHHGNLRAALVEAGIGLLKEKGALELSLRECARLTGVSPAAPSHHFQTKHGLLCAIGEVGFRHLRADMIKASSSVSDSLQRPPAVMKACVRFAHREPALFDLMFVGPVFENPTPELREAALASFEMLDSALSDLEHLSGGRKSESEVATLAAWSTAHGVTRIILGPCMPQRYGKGSDKMAEMVVDFFCRALGSLTSTADAEAVSRKSAGTRRATAALRRRPERHAESDG